MELWSLDQQDSLEEEMTPTPVFMPGESMDKGAWQVMDHRVSKSRKWLKQLSSAQTDYLLYAALWDSNRNTMLDQKYIWCLLQKAYYDVDEIYTKEIIP